MQTLEKWSTQLNIRNLSETYHTPLYIFNRAHLIRNFSSYSSLLKSACNIYYPVKTNPSMAILTTLASAGCGADCSTEHEIFLARLAGIDITKISYYSPAPDLAIAETLLFSGASVILDSMSHIQKLERQLKNLSFSGKLFLRINPGNLPSYNQHTEYQHYTDHGSSFSQFGIASEDVIDCLKQTTLPFSGLHIHVGTQMDNLNVFKAGIEFLHQIVNLIHNQTPHQIQILNLGGGLGIPGKAEDNFPSLSDFVESIEPLMDEKFTYRLEPGNSLVGDTVGLLSSVITRKNMRGREWAILDIGTNQLLKVTMAGFSQTIIDANHHTLPRQGSGTIAGPLCFAGDIILNNTDVSGINEGDPLFLTHCGSYCNAIGSRFNGYKTPGTLMIDDTQIIGLVQTDEDLFWEPTLQSSKLELLLPKENNQSPVSIPNNLVNQMQSKYLAELEHKDNYRFISTQKKGPGIYEFEVDIQSCVPYVSAPFAVRIVGDAAIVATISELNKEIKDISIWGSRMSIVFDGMLMSNQIHKCTITLSPIFNTNKKNRYQTLANWSLDNDCISGTILITF